MASQDESDTIWIKNTERILNSLPNLRLGLYECPYPYKRILNRQIIEWCAKTNRFDFLKDTCCDADLIKDRLAWIRMSGNVGFKLYNANSATLLQSLHDGAAGFTGVMANMHPDLYVWLCEHFNKESDLACQLQAFLSLASMAETLTYPVCAKYHMNLDGVAMLLKSRSEDVIHFNKAQRLLIDHLYTMENTMRGMLAIKKGH